MDYTQMEFRAWDTDPSGEPRMSYFNIVDLVNHGGHLDDIYGNSRPDFSHHMLSTGLVDKNGKKYFHKDIFKTVKNEKLLHVVEYNFGGWGFYDCLQRWNWLYKVAEKSEILGNVYANPELNFNGK